MGRVLGRRLLTLDTTVVVVPANVTVPSPAAHDRPLRPSSRPDRSPPPRSPHPRPGLAEALQTINESAELLAIARRNGSQTAPKP